MAFTVSSERHKQNGVKDIVQTLKRLYLESNHRPLNLQLDALTNKRSVRTMVPLCQDACCTSCVIIIYNSNQKKTTFVPKSSETRDQK